MGRHDNAKRTLPSGHVFQAASGFNVSIHYEDGSGTDSEGDSHRASTTIGHNVLGIESDYLMTDNLKRLLDGNEAIWQENLESVKEYEREYRTHVVQEYYFNKFDKMRYDFLPEVYMRDNTTQDELTEYFDKETNPVLKSLMTDCADDVSGIYKALAFVNKSRQHAYWFMFFSDIYYCNRDLSGFGDLWDEFNWNNDDSILYHMCERDELIQWALKNNLRSERGRGFFKDKLLNKFYAMWRDFKGSMGLKYNATHQGLIIDDMEEEVKLDEAETYRETSRPHEEVKV